MLLRALPFPAATLVFAAALAGCVMPPEGGGPTASPNPRTGGPSNGKIALLVPLTGTNAGLGRDLLRAAQLALGPDGPQLDVQDTGGTPTGATMAAQAAVAAGDAIIVGPLTAPETAAAASVAVAIPILAFTSDRQQGRPGVWALGITPQQQVTRLVRALALDGKTRVAAVLPDNIFGNALVDGLTRATADISDPAPVVKRYPDGKQPALDAALREVADHANRRGAIDAQVQAARQSTDPAVSSQADPLAQQPVPPAPFDALMLAESGAALGRVAAALPGYGIAPPEVQIVGPATWARDAANLGGLKGAWYAAPDPSFRTPFERAYTAKYGTPPPGFADIAYDAAVLARMARGNPAMLTQPNGFRGVDGLFALRPDGQVVRGLALFGIDAGGSHIVEPAQDSVAPGT